MKIKIKKLHPEAKLPEYAHKGDAGMDIFAAEKVVLKPGERAVIRTGVSMEIPEGYVSLVWGKSGLATKHGLEPIGGVIDSAYKGEYLIGMINLSKEEYVFEAGHKVAQILIQKVESPEIVELDSGESLSPSSRGENGFGSTGK